jgi:hypothetical protein
MEQPVRGRFCGAHTQDSDGTCELRAPLVVNQNHLLLAALTKVPGATPLLRRPLSGERVKLTAFQRDEPPSR